jgi:hypothetical protein
MKKLGLKARFSKKFRVTTDSNHNLPIAKNILNREFTVQKPDQTWVTDITYILTDEGWLYLALMIDLFSRQVVGWQVRGCVYPKKWLGSTCIARKEPRQNVSKKSLAFLVEVFPLHSQFKAIMASIPVKIAFSLVLSQTLNRRKFRRTSCRVKPKKQPYGCRK